MLPTPHVLRGDDVAVWPLGEGDVIDRVPVWVIVVFVACVVASWLPFIRYARRTAQEVVPLVGFFLVIASFASDSAGLVTLAVLLFAVATLWAVLSSRPWRRTDRGDEAAPVRPLDPQAASPSGSDGHSGRHRTRSWLRGILARR